MDHTSKGPLFSRIAKKSTKKSDKGQSTKISLTEYKTIYQNRKKKQENNEKKASTSLGTDQSGGKTSQTLNPDTASLSSSSSWIDVQVQEVGTTSEKTQKLVQTKSIVTDPTKDVEKTVEGMIAGKILSSGQNKEPPPSELFKNSQANKQAANAQTIQTTDIQDFKVIKDNLPVQQTSNSKVPPELSYCDDSGTNNPTLPKRSQDGTPSPKYNTFNESLDIYGDLIEDDHNGAHQHWDTTTYSPPGRYRGRSQHQLRAINSAIDDSSNLSALDLYTECIAEETVRGKEKKIKKLQDENDHYVLNIEEIADSLSDLQERYKHVEEQKKQLEEENEVLKTNISSLLKTAQGELSRKNREILNYRLCLQNKGTHELHRKRVQYKPLKGKGKKKNQRADNKNKSPGADGDAPKHQNRTKEAENAPQKENLKETQEGRERDGGSRNREVDRSQKSFKGGRNSEDDRDGRKRKHERTLSRNERKRDDSKKKKVPTATLR